MYSKEVMDHFKNPRNIGGMPDADGIGKIGNKICGDVMWVYIKVKKENGKEKISDIKFQTFGCVAAVSSSSMTTELAKGKTLDEAMKITRDDVAEALEGLPPIKLHCSNLAAEALHAAIRDYYKKTGRLPENRYKSNLN